MEPTTEEIMTTYPKMPCKCGRMARVHPETGKALQHRLGPTHSSAYGAKRAYRKATWCPEAS